LIPRANITAWRAQAPWPSDAQVEQDLVLSRALVQIFADASLAQTLAFRGGTALHKLVLPTPGRYSEDIDLVQMRPEPIGPALEAIRRALDPWLGKSSWKLNQGRATLVYRFNTTSLPIQSLRLKVEINTREHFAVLGFPQQRFVVGNPWFEGDSQVTTYALEELLGTKLRALYQRKKGRDLYDLWLALTTCDVDDEKIVECFNRYLEHGGDAASRAQFEANLAAKIDSAAFREDIAPLLTSGSSFNPVEGAALVHQRLISRLPGAPWKGSEDMFR
jgi:predicted nucleotidyltransferase component of viral defense system